MSNTAPASSSEDITLSLANVPGSELTVYANSVTCPDGTTSCEVSVTQVRGERVPMEPPLGSSFMLAWTIQPAGARFDPPARLCIPNADMAPGQQAEMFSYDHDQEAFIAIGTATVTEDGSQLCSDPGFGVVKGGWHGCVPPPPPPNCTCSCDDGNDCTQDDCSGQPDCNCSHQNLTNSGCCDGVQYDPATQGCCDGQIYTLATSCCENNNVINKNPIADLDECPNRVPNPNWTFQFDGCSNVPDNPAGGSDTQFSNPARTGPCDNHDRCYQTCDPSSGARLACDQQMRTEMRAVCDNSSEGFIIRALCRGFANDYYNGLRLFGGGAFEDRQRQVCNCCP